MKRLLEIAVILGGLLALVAYARPPQTTAGMKPSVQPEGERTPRRPRLPHLFESPAPDGTEPAVDYPAELWFKNIGSRVDNAGMCVFTAAEFVFLWQGLDKFKGFRDWCADHYNGGGYPKKLAALVKKFCEVKGIKPDYFNPDTQLVQYEGDTESALGFLRQGIANGWLLGCTLYRASQYGQGTIYHCVTCAHLDDERMALMDNNPVTKDVPPYLWFPAREAGQHIALQGRVWVFAIVAPGPPPCPTNRAR